MIQINGTMALIQLEVSKLTWNFEQALKETRAYLT